jgi:hypothetical protein
VIKSNIFSKYYKNHIFITFFIFFIWFFLIGVNALNEPFVGDDLHLIREYSKNHLIEVWFDNWDPDGVETRAYRPIAVYFYHLQAFFFKENFFLHHIFSYFLLLNLLIVISFFFKQLNFSNGKISIIIALLAFSKIFTTLSTWITLSPLIFCYIIFFTIGLLFIKFLKKEKNLNFILILFLSFLALFAREELYHLPIFLFFVWIYVSQIKKGYLNHRSAIFIIVIIFSIVLFHFFLRSIFVSNAPQLILSYNSIKGFVVAGLSSGLPGGFNSYTFEEKFIKYLWLFNITIITSSFFYNFNIKNFLKIVILFAIIILLTSPSLVRARDFGIFLPSVFTFSLFSILISEFHNLNKNYNFDSSSIFIKIVIFFTLLTGVVAGYKRSIQHQFTWSAKSIIQLSGDSEWLYGERYKNASIPSKRKEQKIQQLKRANIEKQMSLEEVKNLLEFNPKELSSEIIIPRHKRLKF